MDSIIIPTLGRLTGQVTYYNLPSFVQDKVTFVVQEHEYEEACRYFGRVLCLPPDIKTLSPTREWIHQQFKDKTYFVLDDDLTFHVKVKSFFRLPTEVDFRWFFYRINEQIKDGIYFGGLNQGYGIPTGFKEDNGFINNYRLMTNVWYHGPKIPENLEWNRVICAQDYDVCLQLLQHGFKNSVCTFLYATQRSGKPGGCDTYRTPELRLKSYKKLKEFYGDIIEIQETATRPIVRINWKGAILEHPLDDW